LNACDVVSGIQSRWGRGLAATTVPTGRAAADGSEPTAHARSATVARALASPTRISVSLRSLMGFSE
jgi:hypothetical protein